MGAEYLLISIAVVVIGGTAVAGGNSNVPGIWGASLFMFLVVSMLNTYGFGAGVRLILTGAHHHRRDRRSQPSTEDMILWAPTSWAAYPWNRGRGYSEPAEYAEGEESRIDRTG